MIIIRMAEFKSDKAFDKMDKIKSNNWNRILSILLSQWKCLKYRWSTFFIHASGYTVNNQIYVCQSLMPKNSYWVTWKIFMTCMMSDGKMENYQFFWLRNLSTLNYLFNVMLEGYCMVLSHGRFYKINKICVSWNRFDSSF